MKRVYPAILEHEDGVFLVQFADMENCFTEGDTLYEALENAEDVLNLVLSGMEEDGDPIPTPSDIKDVKAPDGAIVTLVRADTEAYAKMMAEERASGQSEAETAASELAEKTA